MQRVPSGSRQWLLPAKAASVALRRAYREVNSWIPLIVLFVLYKLWIVEGMTIGEICIALYRESGELFPYDFIWTAWAFIYHGIGYLLFGA